MEVVDELYDLVETDLSRDANLVTHAVARDLAFLASAQDGEVRDLELLKRLRFADESGKITPYGQGYHNRLVACKFYDSSRTA